MLQKIIILHVFFQYWSIFQKKPLTVFIKVNINIYIWAIYAYVQAIYHYI